MAIKNILFSRDPMTYFTELNARTGTESDLLLTRTRAFNSCDETITKIEATIKKENNEFKAKGWGVAALVATFATIFFIGSMGSFAIITALLISRSYQSVHDDDLKYIDIIGNMKSSLTPNSKLEENIQGCRLGKGIVNANTGCCRFYKWCEICLRADQMAEWKKRYATQA